MKLFWRKPMVLLKTIYSPAIALRQFSGGREDEILKMNITLPQLKPVGNKI